MTFGCPQHLEKHRVHIAGYEDQDKQKGALDIKNMGLHVIFSSGGGWEHVSVSRQSRTPSYEDMDWLCRQFWDDDVTVMQLHVPREDHVNCHQHCLHLWRPLETEIPRPPSIMVGPK